MSATRRATATVIAVLVLSLSGSATAHGDVSPSISDLDGFYLALGPVGSAIHSEGSWNGAFGGEISFWRISERERVVALGVSAGGVRFSDRKAGHLWADLSTATRLRALPFEPVIGLSAGATAEIDEVVRPRIGAQGTLWLFAGVIPYLRVGSVQKSGTFIELGLKVSLPAIRL